MKSIDENFYEIDDLFARYNISSNPPFEFRNKIKGLISQVLSDERSIIEGIIESNQDDLFDEAKEYIATLNITDLWEIARKLMLKFRIGSQRAIRLSVNCSQVDDLLAKLKQDTRKEGK